MIDVLLISDTADNVNIAWRHFCYSEYSANAATNIQAAMNSLHEKKHAQIVAYYCTDKTGSFYEFYKALRSDPATENIPLVVLADVSWQTVLSKYIKLKNTKVVGISIDDTKLKDIMRTGARSGFEKKPNQSRPPQRSLFAERTNRNNFRR